MDEKVVKLIEQLAQKLGTTTEYLWSVLVKQAPVEAFISLGTFIGALLFGAFLLWLHIRFHKKDYYNEYEGVTILPMVFGAIIFCIWFLCSVFGLGDIVTGFINPEYWALNEILNLMK